MPIIQPRKLLLGAAALLACTAPVSAQDVQSGIAAWQAGDYNAAVQQWRPLADAGNADAQFNLAQAYRLGRGAGVTGRGRGRSAVCTGRGRGSTRGGRGCSTGRPCSGGCS